MTTLPVIDFSAPDAKAQFVDSLHHTGFAVLKNHGINLEKLHQVYAAWEAFFSSDDKFKYPLNHDTNAGFFSTEMSETAKGSTIKDIKEFYHFYPRSHYYPDAVGDITSSLMSDMLALANDLLQAIQDGAPEAVRAKFSMPLRDMIRLGNYHLFRPIHYPALTGNEAPGAIRAAAHTDIVMLTLLFPSSSKGLQVKLSSGEWADVPCDKDFLVINTGDMLDECSGGYFPATYHRVCNPEGEARHKPRLSMPYFLHADDAVVLSDRYTAQTYRHERFVELGIYDKDAPMVNLDAEMAAS